MATCSLETCPHCGASLNSESKYRPFGSPLRMCKACQERIFDDSYIELALFGRDQFKVTRIEPRGIVVAIISLFLLTLVVYSFISGYIGFLALLAGVLIELIVGALALLVVLNGLQNYHRLLKKREAERKASEDRLKNPKYALVLKEHGYQVPKKYLTKVSNLPSEDHHSDTPAENF